jgi:hypothetical protein
VPFRLFFKERNHVASYFIEETYLMYGDIDDMAGGLKKDITFFRELYTYREEYRASTGSTDAEITVPLLDIVHDIGRNGDPGNTGRIRKILRHYASSIVRPN